MSRIAMIAALASLAPMAGLTPLAPGGEIAAQAAPSDDAQILAAARSADLFYQENYDSIASGLKSADEATRVKALSELGHLLDPNTVPLLLPFLQASKHSPAEIVAAANALTATGAEPALPLLHGLLKHPDPTVRVTAMNSLTHIQQIQPNDYKARADDNNGAIRGSSLTNLGRLTQADAATVLAKGLAKDERPHIRRMCAIGLGLLGDRAQGPNLTDALCDADPGVRRYAAEALVKINYTSAIPSLLMALEANVAGSHINHCLRLLSGQDFGFDSRANTLERTAAIEKGFQWWTANAKDLNTK